MLHFFQYSVLQIYSNSLTYPRYLWKKKKLTCVFLFSALTTEGYPFTSFCTIATILDVCVVEKGSHIFSEITIKEIKELLHFANAQIQVEGQSLRTVIYKALKSNGINKHQLPSPPPLFFSKIIPVNLGRTTLSTIVGNSEISASSFSCSCSSQP